MSAPHQSLPAWLSIGVIPLINLAAAFALSALVILAIGESPLEVLQVLVYGAFGFGEAINYTLYYTTNFIFTGLAVAVAFHCGLFNIGGEGQAYIGGLGVAFVCLYLDFLPFILIVPLAILGAGLFGALWAAIPAWLQAKRGSHIVITTIMFNFIAASLMSRLLSYEMKEPGNQSPETRTFLEHAQLPTARDLLTAMGFDAPHGPLNTSLIWALICAVLVWLLIWHTKLGYRIRTVGTNPTAAVFAGISPQKLIILSMLISGALAGSLALNIVMGEQNRLLVGFTAGYGFVGIAVSLMGRNHPLGICFAALLFGALYQGGAEMAFEFPAVSKEIVVVIQGLVILFTGALEHLFRAPIERAWIRRQAAKSAASEGAA